MLHFVFKLTRLKGFIFYHDNQSKQRCNSGFGKYVCNIASVDRKDKTYCINDSV